MALADTVTTAASTLTTATISRTQPVGTFEQGFPLGVADMVSLSLVVLISMGIAALFTAFSMGLGRKLKIVAIPDERSSHARPTPRLGGLGYFVPLTIFFVGITLYPAYLYGPAWAIEPSLKTFFRLALICGSLAFVIGLMDDVVPLPAVFKLFGQIVCAVLFVHLGSQIHYEVTGSLMIEGTRKMVFSKAAFQGAGFDHVSLTQGLVLDGRWTEFVARFGEGAARIPSLPVVITVLWIVALMNAYNFMDGIDGLAATFLIAVSMGLFAIYIPEAGQNMLGLRAHILVGTLMAALFIGTSLGFLFYNRPRARVFLGDGGSQYVGFMLAAFVAQLVRAAGEPAADLNNRELELTLPERAYVDFLAVLILVWPFLYDVIYTLIRRTVRLRPIWRAHHEHLYQRLIDLGWSHGLVVGFSLPFYLAHAAIFYMYCWAPNDGMRWTWAAIALAPMFFYTLTVIACEAARCQAPAAAPGLEGKPPAAESKPDAQGKTPEPAQPDKDPAESTENAPIEGAEKRANP